MTDELKTLKDLRMEKIFGKDDYMISEFVLKTEAVKWIKYLEINLLNETTKIQVTTWIKHFFNLKEEDLK